MIFLTCIILHMCLFVQTGRLKRVIEGVDVACGAQPRILSLRNATDLTHLCGATLLSPEFAVTAAHCVHFTEKNYVLQANNYCITDGTPYPTAKIMEIITNDQYDRDSRAHDIAILRVSLELDDITWHDSNILLPSSTFGLSGACTIYGYGYKKHNTKEFPENLLAGKLELVSLDECIEKLGPYVAPKYDSGMLCAAGGHVDACQGDSGSPLICSDDTIEGICSYGMSCGVPNLPGVYTSVSAHLEWIQEVMFNKYLPINS